MPLIRRCLTFVALTAYLATVLAGEEPDPGEVARQQIAAVHDEIQSITDLAAQPKLEAARNACLALEARTLLPDATSDLMYILVQVPYNAGCYSALQGRSDEAFTSLERAVALGYDDVDHITKDSDLESLRADPRFAALLAHARQRVGISSERGTLCEPSIRTLDFSQESQGAKDSAHLALRIPVAGGLHERVLWLVCTPAQEQQLADLMAHGKTVCVTGTGGTYTTWFRLTVTSFSVVEP